MDAVFGARKLWSKSAGKRGGCRGTWRDLAWFRWTCRTTARVVAYSDGVRAVAWLDQADHRRRITAIGIAAATIVYALLAFNRRWIADDGLIVVRTVREILDGHGPVYSSFERAEANTSTAWTYLLVVIAFVSRARVAHIAVYTGLASAVLALGVGLDAARRFHRARGTDGMLVPASAFIVLAVYPFWDYATSGLENGLCLAWLAITWWLLVRLRTSATAMRSREPMVFAIVVGLGPLVRPEFAIVTVGFGVAGWLIVRPPWRRTLLLIGMAGVLPVAYEIFRAGYYGTLVPVPALTKSAAHTEWNRGYHHLREMLRPYKLQVPLLVLTGTLAVPLARRQLEPRDRVLVLAPVLSGLLLSLYVVRVGGDFMHGRMWLSPLFLLSLPALVLPVTKRSAIVLGVLACWGIIIGATVHDRSGVVQNPIVGDERLGYIRFTGTPHPTDEDPFVARVAAANQTISNAIGEHRRLLVFEDGHELPLASEHPTPIAIVVGRLGVGGALVPLDATVVDTLGLANPLGARITETQPGSQPGHRKALPLAWVLADLAAPEAVPPDVDAKAIGAARHAMSCGELAELLASVREPMSWSRFWSNVRGSVRRTRLVIPSDPVDAERAFCK